MNGISAFVLALSLAAAAGCARNRPFAPTDADTIGPKGYKTAVYRIRTQNDDWGQIRVRIWTRGVGTGVTTAENELKNPSRRVEIVFEVVNNSNDTVRLDENRTRLTLRADPPSAKPLAPERPEAPEKFVPQSDTEMELFFDLPEQVDPKDVEGFELHWTLVSAKGTYSQSTPFHRERDGRPPVYYAPYDPYYFDFPHDYPRGYPYPRDMYFHPRASFGIGFQFAD